MKPALKSLKAQEPVLIARGTARLILIVLLLLCAAAWRDSLYQNLTRLKKGRPAVDEPLPLSFYRAGFPAATQVKSIDTDSVEIYSNGELLGRVFSTRGKPGYGGRIPLHAFVGLDGKISQVVLGPNNEGKSYLDLLAHDGFLDRWQNVAFEDSHTHSVDAISGATLSSRAIINGMYELSATSNTPAPKKSFRPMVEQAVSILLLGLITGAFLFPKVFAKQRTKLQVASLAVYGIWLNQSLSLAQFINWISGSINWRYQVGGLLLLIVSGTVAIVYGRSLYCTVICPFGCAQDICNRLVKKQAKIPTAWMTCLRYTRRTVIALLLLLMWCGVPLDLSLAEPFTFFSFQAGNPYVFTVATLFLVISFFVPRAWCRFCCPTGYLLEWLRKDDPNMGNR